MTADRDRVVRERELAKMIADRLIAMRGDASRGTLLPMPYEAVVQLLLDVRNEAKAIGAAAERAAVVGLRAALLDARKALMSADQLHQEVRGGSSEEFYAAMRLKAEVQKLHLYIGDLRGFSA
jgi:hypothetical protein